MYFPVASCMSASLGESGCCVNVVAPVGVASRSGLIGVVVHDVNCGFHPVGLCGATGG